MERQIFLARNGKTTGPYTELQIEEMTENGELYKYEWIWDGESPDWTPVPKKGKTPPPKPDVTITKIEVPDEAEVLLATPSPTLKKTQTLNTHQTQNEMHSKKFSTILYDNEKSLSGKLWKIDSSHAKFLTNTHQDPHKIGQTVWVDILNDEKDMAYKARCAINSIQLNPQNEWEMTLFIESFPF